jgi:VIT1/CCC1 family predicted Fe2+/Mn2+ transporter
MTSKCDCQQCGQSLEFEASQLEKSGETSHRILGQQIECPHCQQPTQLYMPRFSAAPVAPIPVPARKRNGGVIALAYAFAVLIPVIGFFFGIYLLGKRDFVTGLLVLFLSLFCSVAAIWALSLFQFLSH